MSAGPKFSVPLDSISKIIKDVIQTLANTEDDQNDLTANLINNITNHVKFRNRPDSNTTNE